MMKLARWSSIALATAFIAAACTADDGGETSPNDVGQAGDSSDAGSGASTGGSGASTGASGASGGGAAAAPGWTCDSGYDLASYNGDQTGLCPANESRWIECCPDDITPAVTIVCAPDGSVCVAVGGATCTTYNTHTECGWTFCDPNAQGTGGAGGASTSDCPRDKVANPAPLVPCASDVHCEDMRQVCNQRIANRMFCGDPDGSSQGGSGG